ncbi:cytochrome b5-related protein-like [Anthonomus grandis grandis]|uniref:cytochrome b5-related protein-like n=1 Tax=Anthonomus grandis grandis TaxID=2921223 RepID=UPI002166649E|nr:cytochrome b5-related protein-like [Anthonomus grandis grandis]
MPPYISELPPSSLGIAAPPRRQKNPSVDMWLEDKVATDNAEGLWRLDDGLYDLTAFIHKHPGGAEWLELSKGLDITEAFEVHHLTEQPKEILKKYFVRKAKKKRNSPFTFKEDGFYKTLKREIVKVLPTLPRQSERTTDFFIDSFLVILFFMGTIACKYWNFFYGTLAGNFLGFLTIAAHNYFHKKDNFRMYYFNFSLQTVREWRISHVLSHHLHTNTIDDYEILSAEPFLNYLPVEKSNFRRYGQWFWAPVFWSTGFHRAFVGRIVEYIRGRRNHIKKTDFIAFTFPLFMYIFGGQPLLWTLLMWTYIVVIGSTHLFFVGLHAAHHHPEIFHDGDQPREEYDWGIGQLDAIMERKEISGSHFLVLTNFGDHALHHMFPTIDHATLELLYPTFKRVLAEFGTNLRMVSQLDTLAGGFQQLIKVTPSAAPPDLNKWDINKVK